MLKHIFFLLGSFYEYQVFRADRIGFVFGGLCRAGSV
ncbi:hypothetical protein M717_12750 [Neisseria gonorrhoeae SK33414]|uniref:Uncharacterized protein n=1 Tax=Neisseria gonorrhoeae 3502 TaxID=1193404 RepID=A0AA44UAH9_NEIGO|nr:hypothetical protein M717_12750 [Neisseria gonorrhoeae SK33414]KLR80177.1 hypothetical protein M679_10855 [Neisseria gonorrhoeae SK7842]KLR81343.1 hypothetical protein M680_06555 [Neisseria gonorrhoeae SK8976]KLR85706.1 hypothetical protein M684_07100 [Neisseria gonorrhoeae SK15454]KLR88873.1 hypothetical protein M702_11795 [Neisseria gonorrhoeae SK28355]KLR99669.1 hypothetical protein M674_06135 [Neisseria gonorrhoeae SK708]KLS01448.1 hypothetical protein M683_03810 [Neisseria gonorrhoeae